MTGVKRIAIIGGGPTGIACAKYLVAEKAFDRIDIFEQRSNVGGIWNLSEPTASKRILIPQTNPLYGARHGQQSDDYHTDHHRLDEQAALELESPLYDYLETNIPKTMMAFSDHPFSPELPLYPGHADVLKYLENDAVSVMHLIRFQTQVIDVRVRQSARVASESSSFGHHWQVTTQDLTTLASKSACYDAVVIANGHYTVPHVPEIPGLAAWNKKYPNTIIHSKAYRRPEDFKGKRVLVVGNSASGLDIAAQLAPYIRQPLYLTSRSTSQLAPSGGGPKWRKDIAEIGEFLVDDAHDRSVRSKDGTIVNGIDSVIFATGYFYSFPFVSTSDEISEAMSTNPSTTSVTPEQSDIETDDGQSISFPTLDPLHRLITSGLRTHDVYKHFLHIDYPTLAIPVLNLKIVPFPLSENQAAVISRLWSGRLNVPSTLEMRRWEKDEQQRLLEANRLRPVPVITTNNGISANNDNYSSKIHYESGFHTLIYPEDAKQINTLYDWAASARLREGLENEGMGKLGTRWHESQVWLRGQFPNVKAAYARQGDARHTITSLDKLGEEWSNGFQMWKSTTSETEQKRLFIAAATPGWS